MSPLLPSLLSCSVCVRTFVCPSNCLPLFATCVCVCVCCLGWSVRVESSRLFAFATQVRVIKRVSFSDFPIKFICCLQLPSRTSYLSNPPLLCIVCVFVRGGRQNGCQLACVLSALLLCVSVSFTLSHTHSLAFHLPLSLSLPYSLTLSLCSMQNLFGLKAFACFGHLIGDSSLHSFAFIAFIRVRFVECFVLSAALRFSCTLGTSFCHALSALQRGNQ